MPNNINKPNTNTHNNKGKETTNPHQQHNTLRLNLADITNNYKKADIAQAIELLGTHLIPLCAAIDPVMRLYAEENHRAQVDLATPLNMEAWYQRGVDRESREIRTIYGNLIADIILNLIYTPCLIQRLNHEDIKRGIHPHTCIEYLLISLHKHHLDWTASYFALATL